MAARHACAGGGFPARGRRPRDRPGHRLRRCARGRRRVGRGHRPPRRAGGAGGGRPAGGHRRRAAARSAGQRGGRPGPAAAAGHALAQLQRARPAAAGRRRPCRAAGPDHHAAGRRRQAAPLALAAPGAGPVAAGLCTGPAPGRPARRHAAPRRQPARVQRRPAALAGGWPGQGHAALGLARLGGGPAAVCRTGPGHAGARRQPGPARAGARPGGGGRQLGLLWQPRDDSPGPAAQRRPDGLCLRHAARWPGAAPAAGRAGRCRAAAGGAARRVGLAAAPPGTGRRPARHLAGQRRFGGGGAGPAGLAAATGVAGRTGADAAAGRAAGGLVAAALDAGRPPPTGLRAQRGRGRQPRQERLSGQCQPRDPHADECAAGRGRAAGRITVDR